MSVFQLTELAVGNGTLGLCHAPGRDGDYAGDLAALCAWAPDIVLTLIEDHEATKIGCASLGADLRRSDIAWAHFSIADYGIPDKQAAVSWCHLAHEIHRSLNQGGRIVIHCKGGCGRTGMIAMRLMVMCNEDAEAALTRLRMVRPCAIETEEQLIWAAPSLRGL